MGLLQDRQAKRDLNTRYKTASRILDDALGREKKVSSGTLYVDGASKPFNYRLTQTRLLWNRMECPDVDGLSFTEVRRFVYHQRDKWTNESPSLDIDLDNRRLRLNVLPSEVTGPRFSEHQSYVLTVITQNMRLFGAEERSA